MNSFCHNCIIKDIPKSIKDKFNEHYKPTFLECPTNDPKVVGCLIKEQVVINWNSFCNWLKDLGELTPEEAIIMTELGLLKLRGKRGKK